MTCSERDTPPIDIEGSSTGKLIGPTPKTVLPGIPPVREHLFDVELGFAGPGPVPEIPPPRT
jgi:hypothetical protein